MIRQHMVRALSCTLLAFFMVIPLVSLAAPVTFDGLSESSVAAGLVTCSGPDCTFCSLVKMIDGIIDWVIRFAVIIAVLSLVVTGFKMVMSQGKTNEWTKAKDQLVNIFIGMLIIFVAWMIVDTLLKLLLSNTAAQEVAKFGPWNPVAGNNCGGQNQSGGTKSTGGITIKDNPNNLSVDEIDLSADASIVNVTTGPNGSGVFVGTTGANCPAASESSVVTIPGTSKKASPDTVSRFIKMRDAAARDGITLSVNSGWRSEATQVEIWNRHNCNNVDCSGTVARPCTLGGNGSNHNSGKALDIQLGYGDATYNWLKTNGGMYGFYNNLGSKDPVHWSPTGR